MSHVIFPGSITRVPDINLARASNPPGVTLNAAGEVCYFIGDIFLENPLGGSKTISSAGGGSIVWRSRAVTFANAGTTFEIGLQDLSTASAPGQGDGTFDVKASFTGGGGGVTANAVQTSVMTSGTKTLAHGDKVAISFSTTAIGGADSIIVATNDPGVYATSAMLWPCVTSNVTGVIEHTFGSMPNAYIIFDDRTKGFFYGAIFTASTTTAKTFTLSTSPDEYGNLINLPFTFYALGIGGNIGFGSTSSDLEMILYSDPLGTPSAIRTASVDATQIAVHSYTGYQIAKMFSSPVEIKARTNYGITVRPTAAQDVDIYYIDGTSSSASIGMPNSSCYSISRTNNSGAFAQHNGGVDNSRLMFLWLFGSHYEQGVNKSSYRIGI